MNKKSRGVAILLALILGGIGVHKFYLERPKIGLMYLLFFWTFVPAFLALIDIFILAFTSQENFNKKYN